MTLTIECGEQKVVQITRIKSMSRNRRPPFKVRCNNIFLIQYYFINRTRQLFRRFADISNFQMFSQSVLI